MAATRLAAAVRLPIVLAVLVALTALAAAAPASAQSAGAACELVASGPDYVLYLCVDPGAPCRVYTVTYGHEGATTTHCVLA